MMLRKLFALSAAVVLVMGMVSTATASTFIANESQLQVQLSALPTITVKGTWTGLATVSNGAGSGHGVSVDASIFVTENNSVGTSLLTGVALLTNLTLTATNQTGSFTSAFSTPNPVGGGNVTTSASSVTLCPGGCLGGSEAFTGQFVLGVLGLIQLPFDLSVVGVGGTTILPLGGNNIVATGAPFVTGKFRITGVTTNVISMPGRGGVTGIGLTLKPAGSEEVRTFTTNGGFITSNPGANLSTRPSVLVEGGNDLTSASAAGTVVLISPLRVNTGALGVNNIPGIFTQTMTFVPEPGTALLLVSGAAGLVLIGRSRMRR
jgi:hypothetical protein